MSVAWPQKTVKGFVPPGKLENQDPYTESGQRRARAPAVAWVGSCKTLIMGSNPIVASSQRGATLGNTGQHASPARDALRLPACSTRG